MKASIDQVCADIQAIIRATKQKYLKRNISLEEIPTEHLDILFFYLPVKLICELFGGNYQVALKSFSLRMKEKETAERQQKISDEADREENFEPKDPSGIGDWFYSERLKQKVFRSLETVLNQGVGVAGHSQFVQAAKALLIEAEKTKENAVEIMMAYEAQLILLAEHLVESFLPELASILKKDLKDSKDSVIKNISEIAKPDKHSLSLWKAEIGKVVRAFNLKRFELLLAETIAKSPEVSEAFDFTQDLIINYKQKAEINVDDKSKLLLKDHIRKRS